MSSPATSRAKLARTSALAIATTAADAVGAFAVSVLIGRLLGQRPTGQYGYVQSLSAVLLGIFGLGLPSYLVLAVAGNAASWRETSRHVLGLYLGMTVPLALAGVGAAVATSAEIGPAEVVVPAVVSVFALGFTGMVLACLQGLGDFGTGLAASLATRISAAAAVVAVHLAGAGLPAFLAVLALVQVGVAVAVGAALSRRSQGLLAIPSREGLRHLRASWPFGVLVLLEMVYFKADTVLLRWWHGDGETGLYVAAYTLYTLPLLFGNAVASSFYPWVARRRAEGQSARSARDLVSLALVGFGLAAAGVTVLAGPWALTFIYGKRFAAAGGLLQILAAALPFALASRFGIISLKAHGRLRPGILAAALAAVVAVAGNLLVMPRYGAQGAALVTVATELSLLLGAAALGAWSRRD